MKQYLEGFLTPTDVELNDAKSDKDISLCDILLNFSFPRYRSNYARLSQFSDVLTGNKRTHEGVRS